MTVVNTPIYSQISFLSKNTNFLFCYWVVFRAFWSAHHRVGVHTHAKKFEKRTIIFNMLHDCTKHAIYKIIQYIFFSILRLIKQRLISLSLSLFHSFYLFFNTTYSVPLNSHTFLFPCLSSFALQNVLKAFPVSCLLFICSSIFVVIQGAALFFLISTYFTLISECILSKNLIIPSFFRLRSSI